MDIAIIGEKKSVLAFQALGVETFGVSFDKDIADCLDEIKKKDFAVIFVTEDIMEKYEKEIAPLTKNVLPAVLVVPGIKGKGRMGAQGLKKIMERALGSDTLNV